MNTRKAFITKIISTFPTIEIFVEIPTIISVIDSAMASRATVVPFFINKKLFNLKTNFLFMKIILYETQP